MAKNSAIPKQDFFNLYLELVDTIVEVIFVLPQSQDQKCRSLQFLPAYNCTVAKWHSVLVDDHYSVVFINGFSSTWTKKTILAGGLLGELLFDLNNAFLLK